MLDALPHLGFEFGSRHSVAAAGRFRTRRPTARPPKSAAPPEEILFVANHAFDCVGAKAFGTRAAFIDRRRRQSGDGRTSLTSSSVFYRLVDVLLWG
jgi:2-haloacid dehalogenase